MTSGTPLPHVGEQESRFRRTPQRSLLGMYETQATEQALHALRLGGARALHNSPHGSVRHESLHKHLSNSTTAKPGINDKVLQRRNSPVIDILICDSEGRTDSMGSLARNNELARDG